MKGIWPLGAASSRYLREWRAPQFWSCDPRGFFRYSHSHWEGGTTDGKNEKISGCDSASAAHCQRAVRRLRETKDLESAQHVRMPPVLHVLQTLEPRQNRRT